jgi:hypothetical protein
MHYDYTDPLAAAWMAKHFGIRLCSEIGFDLDASSICADMLERGNEWADWKEKYYVHHDSLPLWEPKVGDLAFVHEFRGDGVRLYTQALGEFASEKNYPIIQRDGRPFLWPTSEAT